MRCPQYLCLTTLAFFILPLLLSAQEGIIRGNIYDKTDGTPIVLGNVVLAGTDLGAITNTEGFFTMAGLPAGSYSLRITYLGYDTLTIDVQLAEDQIFYQRFYLNPVSTQLSTVNISGERSRAKTEIQLSKLSVNQEEIKAVPSIGGEADIAQYLTVLPGIISTGDQGGQLYIRGGSPVQNKILLDGMTIYNPFHSLGLFSVFETETVQQMDVYSAGFNAEYGGRISAVVDINTRSGNKKKISGLVSGSPFQAKALIEGPIIPLKEEGGGSISFLFTGKHALIDQTSKTLYPYAVDTSFYSFASGAQDLENAGEEIGLPFDYTDLYGKVTLAGANGSELNLFGFGFSDQFQFSGLAALDWQASGGGANFNLVPPNSSVTVDGQATYSSYEATLLERDEDARISGINNYRANINFTYFGRNNQLKYGFGFNGFNTDFQFRNQFGVTFTQADFTSELFGYFKYRQQLGRLILEPGVRLHYYSSQATLSPEPRLGVKYNVTESIRLKMGGGLYSQNLISTVREDDVVNFFVGFLAGPEESLKLPTGEAASNQLQKAFHAVAGLEFDLGDKITATAETYYKGFTQLIQINRNKTAATDPDFVTETGEAYGVDLTLERKTGRSHLWLAYSLAYVNRDNGEQVFPTIFDRRHNLNLVGTFALDAQRYWTIGIRWNLGSGFPFTQTQGFYQENNFDDLVLTDVIRGNFGLGTILSDNLNAGRFPWYHRLDINLKRVIKLVGSSELEFNLSATNVYNRENIFYVDRITNNRVNQLPIIPSLGLTFRF